MTLIRTNCNNIELQVASGVAKGSNVVNVCFSIPCQNLAIAGGSSSLLVDIKCPEGYAEVWRDEHNVCANSTAVLNGASAKRCCRYMFQSSFRFCHSFFRFSLCVEELQVFDCKTT
jgi:hypothetical protein